MARYKHYDYGPMKNEDLDLSVFESRYHNDETGAPAYDPAILLKIILLAYARGVTSSRRIEQLCRENVVFMALSADSCPPFTTIAEFVCSLEGEIVSMVRDVLLGCDELGLIGTSASCSDTGNRKMTRTKERINALKNQKTGLTRVSGTTSTNQL